MTVTRSGIITVFEISVPGECGIPYRGHLVSFYGRLYGKVFRRARIDDDLRPVTPVLQVRRVLIGAPVECIPFVECGLGGRSTG